MTHSRTDVTVGYYTRYRFFVTLLAELFVGHDPNPRVGSGKIRHLTGRVRPRAGLGRVGSGQEAFQFSRIGSGYRYPARPDLA